MCGVAYKCAPNFWLRCQGHPISYVITKNASGHQLSSFVEVKSSKVEKRS